MRNLLIVSFFLLTFNMGFGQTLDELLLSVEENNVALKAQRELAGAQTLGAKVGNSLANPTVSYDHLWGGAPGQSEKRGEMKVVQEFDFPTEYINRNALARERAVQYGHEYSVARQQIMLQVKTEYISLTHLNQLKGIQSKRLRQIKEVADSYVKRLASGDANILEKKRADIELLNMNRAFDQTKLEIAATQNRLIALNGDKPTNLSVEAECDFLSADVLPFDQMLALYEKSDPQMLLLNSELSVAQKDVKVSRGASLPKIELGYRYDYAPGENFNGVVMGLSIPMFGNRNNVKRAKAQEQYAKTQIQSNRVDLKTKLQELYDRRSLLYSTLNNFDMTHDDHSFLLTDALNAGQMSITEYYTEMNVYYDVFENYILMLRDYNIVCAQIDAVKL